jgi:pimeloyl-ACP methyl ester carboxylesterase
MKTDEHQKLRNSIWQQLHDSGSEALAEFMLLTAYSSRFVATRQPAELQKLLAGIKGGPSRARKMRLNRTIDISAKLSGIRARTLVIGCSDDQMAPIRHSHALFGAIDDSRFVEISSGHAVVHERPAELFTRIDNFVQGVDSEDAGIVLAPVHA